MDIDSYNLDRFVNAQAPIYEQVLAELRAGRKTSHWMWFIFPQIAGLGTSATALHFAIQSLAEARAYMAHSVLGPRLIECTEAVNALHGESLARIFGSPDDMKFRSSMTLFAAASDAACFDAALGKYCNGQRDAATLQKI